MLDVLAICGSPTAHSRSRLLADRVLSIAASAGSETARVCVRDLPAAELLRASVEEADIAASLRLVASARALVVTTPIYKAAYTGLLKTFIDVLPLTALAGKLILPIATAGSAAHALALEHALKPVLASLSPRLILPGLVVLDREPEVDALLLPQVDLLLELLKKGH
ncbi:MAG: NADPH-dependent reductase [bacterium]|nr:NADPH-dependent reductase [bacterium]